MKFDMVKLFTLQRQIFGVCPDCNELFRLSDAKVFLRRQPAPDWMEKLLIRQDKLQAAEDRLDEREGALRDKARLKGRRLAMRSVRKIDAVFTPRKLNPDDAKVIFHPIDYVVFNGMKGSGSIKSIVLLDREARSSEHKQIQKSIERCVTKASYFRQIAVPSGSSARSNSPQLWLPPPP